MAKIILDPGHVEGYNRGAVSGYYEGTAMYHYAYRLADKLRAAGLDVGITRTKITDNPSLTARGKQAKGADMFVSLHSNAASSASANGVTVFYSIKRNADKPHATKWCNELAGLINGGTRARGASTRKGSGNWDYYTVIQSAVAAGCPHVFLIEHGFHSNKKECTWLMQPANMEAMATLECGLICDILGVKASGGTTHAPASFGQKMVNTPDDTLNVRDAANVNGKKLGALKDRSLVEVYGLAGNGWVLIQQGSLRGWVNGKYLVEPEKTFAPYIVRVTADALNIRKGPGTNYDVAGCIRDKGSYTIIGEQDGWGRLKSGAGWISLAYTTKVGDADAKPELTRILKLTSPNMRGEDVRWAQARLNALGYNCGTPDGIFGPNTDKAVKAFQRANGLSQDGDIGPKTWAKL